MMHHPGSRVHSRLLKEMINDYKKKENFEKACDRVYEKLEELKNRMLSGEYLRRN